MKKVLTMGLILALCLCGCGQETGTDDLEKFTWGMTRDEVIEEKGSQPDETKEDGKELVYKGEKRYGLPCDVSYEFYTGDTLEGIYYYYSESYEDISEYQEEFQAVSGQMKEKFGEPKQTLDFTEEEPGSEYEYLKGVKLYENWRQGETTINHMIRESEDTGIMHYTYYLKS